MILHTGMRTDIPAFYTPWLINRLRAGTVSVRNPFDPAQVTRYRIDPAVVDLIGFCTKNPAPMLPHMELLAPFGQLWHVTITAYGRDVEPYVPPWRAVAASFRRLSEIVGVPRIAWRYDPVFINETYTPDFHRRAFAEIAETLAGTTETVIISFITRYAKTMRNFPGVRAVMPADRMELGAHIIETARAHGMTVYPCGGGKELAACGADCGGCMTQRIYERALGRRMRFPQYTRRRKECDCYLGADIGVYDSCGHLCRYCYATSHEARMRRNIRTHDPMSPFLLGRAAPGDRVHTPRQESWLDVQEALF
ncbi:DUF1848 domain-containing protein [Selenomonas sp. F0473]|uniref:DUF1848 domain-containing protein n=1 Tax=Selenomonas sp. F0473 TaxID=999423 RepID=UPI00029E0586|nr:DUF1848 domain-containing protein [Selenomonas sp. F0473]EKU70764.1 hypothetical protein HMPREF9161_01810 [Selenomonas sp. F0473]